MLPNRLLSTSLHKRKSIDSTNSSVISTSLIGKAFKGMTLEMHNDAHNANSMIVRSKMSE